MEKVRKGLWDKREPNSQLVYPHVHIMNPEPLRRSMNRALLEQVRGLVDEQRSVVLSAVSTAPQANS